MVPTLAGVILAIILYRNRPSDPLDFALLRKRFYFDELYSFPISATQGLLASVSAFIDRWILDVGFIRGASTTTWGIGSLLRFLQVGNLQAYSFLFGLGIRHVGIVTARDLMKSFGTVEALETAALGENGLAELASAGSRARSQAPSFAMSMPSIDRTPSTRSISTDAADSETRTRSRDRGCTP